MDEVSKAIEDMTPVIENNPEAKAFLEGFKHGLLCGRPNEEKK